MELNAKSDVSIPIVKMLNASFWSCVLVASLLTEPINPLVPLFLILAFFPWFNRIRWIAVSLASLLWVGALEYMHMRLNNGWYYTEGEYYVALAKIVAYHIAILIPLIAYTERKLDLFGAMAGCLVACAIVLAFLFSSARAIEKPVIYLYPETETTVHVQLDYDGQLTHTYPAYGSNGWTVRAKPDGTLTDPNTGREYYCLFWEGKDNEAYTINSGFVVAGKDTVEFLEQSLTMLGLSNREANEFIIYWQPRLEGNPYNLVHFATDAYAENVPMHVTPAPDSTIRVMMVYRPLAKLITIPEQVLTTPERKGFTVVEWGGTELPQSGLDRLLRAFS